MGTESERPARALTEQGIREFVAAWYRALDVHVPLQEAYSFLTERGLRMDFPDGAIRDFPTFKTWYERVTNLFFDENHYVQTVDSKIEGDLATVNILVGWQASFWQAPEAKSRRTSMDATQRWTIRPSSRNTYGLEIVTYQAMVEPFRYAPGFARL